MNTSYPIFKEVAPLNLRTDAEGQQVSNGDKPGPILVPFTIGNVVSEYRVSLIKNPTEGRNRWVASTLIKGDRYFKGRGSTVREALRMLRFAIEDNVKERNDRVLRSHSHRRFRRGQRPFYT